MYWNTHPATRVTTAALPSHQVATTLLVKQDTISSTEPMM